MTDQLPHLDDLDEMTCKCGGSSFIRLADGWLECKDCGRVWHEDVLESDPLPQKGLASDKNS